MLPILLVIALFIFWLFVGYAIINLLHSKSKPLQKALLAPVIGMSVTLLLVFWCNRLGIPVKFLGFPIAIGLLSLSVIIYLIQKRDFFGKFYLSFVFIFIFLLFLFLSFLFF